MHWNRVYILGIGAVLLAATALATVFGTVRGVVHDPDHRPIGSATVRIRARASGYARETRTTADGEFQFSAIPAGEYTVVVERDGFGTEEQLVVVASSGAPVLHFQLKLAERKDSIQVTEKADGVATESATPTTLINRSDISRTPGADRTNSLTMITSYVPGAYMTHDQLHVRGGHQVTWLVDGVPVPNTNIASNVGPQFDPKDADYVEAQRGSYSAEYGDRTYGVFDMVPRTGFERNGDAELVASYGNFHQTNDQFSVGNHTERFAWYGSVNGNRSDLGLQTPTSAVLHDRADGLGGFGTLIFNARPTDQLRLVTSLRRDDYQIPNSPEDQANGIRDNDLERDAFVNFSWVHTISPAVLLTVSPFYHFNRADFAGGPNDPGFNTQDRQSSHYAGAQVTVSAVSGRHNVRAGIYGFGQHDSRLFSLAATDGSRPTLRQALSPYGHLAALFFQEEFKVTSWLTLNGGLRLTHFGGAISENAADPRAGASVRIPFLHWTAHGFYARYYQAPPLSTISGPALDFALEQGLGFLPLHGERNEENQVGLTIPLFGWQLDGDHFHIHTRNFFDHDALGNSNVFLPLTIAAARVDGWEVTLRSPMLWRHGRMHLAYSSQSAQAAGAVSGGLTDFSPPEEGYFLLDHDQRHTLSIGGTANLPRRVWLGGNLYYGSGFPDNGGPARLPGHITVDLTAGKGFTENCSVSVQVLNAGNRRVLLDNSLTFGGTHYMDPRQVYVELRYRFRL